MKRILIVVVICAFMASMMMGCSEKIAQPENKASESGETNKAKNENKAENDNKPAGNENNSEEKSSVVLYFSDKEAMYVVREEREIQASTELSVSEKARLILEELITGSVNAGYSTSIPNETKVLSVKLDGNTIVVDLSKEFVEEHVGGSAGVTMTMAPIVLSLTELDGIDQVSFKIEGEVLEEFKGHIEFNRAFKREDYEQVIAK